MKNEQSSDHMSIETFTIFFTATFLIVLSPGAAAMTVMGQSSGSGALRAGAGILGIALANTTYFLLSAFGLTAVLIASPMLFAAIKWVGVAYLLWLGIRAILASATGLGTVKTIAPKSAFALFRQGYLVEIANPKALLYVGAALPQFLDLTRPPLPQFAIMGAATFVIDCTIYAAYAGLGAAVAKGILGRSGMRALNLIIGLALIYVAVSMTFIEKSTS